MSKFYSRLCFSCSFTYINVGSPGRNNDSYVYENSILKRLHRCSPIIQSNYRNIGGESVPVLLIGDSAFRLSPFLMKPFAVASSAIERNFNYRLSKCRGQILNVETKNEHKWKRNENENERNWRWYSEIRIVFIDEKF